MSTNITPDGPDLATLGDLLHLHVSQLEYAFQDQPDANTAARAAWEKAIPKKVNRLAKLLITAPAAPALPPVTICALFLHNIRSRTKAPFDFTQFQPVKSSHPALSNGPEGLSIPADFTGTQFPLLPRDQVNLNWWTETGMLFPNV